MRLCVITDEISQDLEVAVRVAREYRCAAIELRNAWEKGPHQLSQRQAHDVGLLLREHRLACANIAGPVFKSPLGDDDALREHLDILSRCLDLAERLGAPTVRAFTFWRTPDATDTGLLERVRAGVEKAIPIVERRERLLLIENEHETIIGSGKVLRQFIDGLSSPLVGAIWDPCNAFCDPQSEPPFPEGYDAIKPHIRHVHVKDAVRTGDARYARCVPVGDGDVQLEPLFRALLKDGYNGYLSLETHWRPSDDRPGAGAALPSNTVLPGEGEVATRTCLEKMIRLLESAGWRWKEAAAL